MKFSINKPLLQSLYYFSKVHGLVPFGFDFDRRRAYASNASLLYSIAFTIILSSYLTYYMYVFCVVVITMDEDLVIVLVLICDIVIACLNGISLYILQLVQRRKIIELINSFMKIFELIIEQDRVECNRKLRFKSFFDEKLTNSCGMKCISVVIQIITGIISFSIYEYNLSFYQTFQNGIVTWFTCITCTMTNTVFYCGGMLFSARFYQILNKQIKRLTKSMDCSANIENNIHSIDRISFLYQHITTLTSKLCRIYAFQITISLIGIVMWILACVRIENL